MNRRGFTLIELFVVLTTIGVLAAITVPNFKTCGRPRRNDPHYCLSRLKTLTGAIEMYQLDKGLKAPPLGAPVLAALETGGYLQTDVTRREVAGSCRYQSVEGNPCLIACATHGTIEQMELRFDEERTRKRQREQFEEDRRTLGCVMLVLFGVWCWKMSRSAKFGPPPVPKAFASSPRLPRPTARVLPVVQAVQFLDAPLPVRDGARCPVCSTALAGEALACASCDSVHHAECFNYNGCCGIYGCGSKRVNRAVCGGPVTPLRC